MGKTKQEKTIDQLLEREKRSNRIKTTSLIAIAALVLGIVIGHFGSIEITSQAQRTVVNSIVLKAEK
jgi:hypothetical protein